MQQQPRCSVPSIHPSISSSQLVSFLLGSENVCTQNKCSQARQTFFYKLGVTGITVKFDVFTILTYFGCVHLSWIQDAWHFWPLMHDPKKFQLHGNIFFCCGIKLQQTTATKRLHCLAVGTHLVHHCAAMSTGVEIFCPTHQHLFYFW